MSIKIRLIFLFQLISVFGFCQSSLQNKKDSIKILCAEWQLIESKSNGVDAPSAPDGSQIINYRKDGSFVMQGMGVTIEGKWNLDTKNKQIITHDEEGRKVWRILKLSPTELIVEVKEDGEKFVGTFNRKS